MTRARPPGPARAPQRRGRRAARLAPGRERALVLALLVVHAALVIWAAARNSVTYDENFHLPSGVMIASRGEFRISAVNPPLVKALGGAAALAAGARLPADSALAIGEQFVVGESFERANADRYQRVFFAARMVVLACSLALAWLVWRFARRWYGPWGGVLATGFYALSPDAVAHGGVFTMDVPTALGWLATLYAFHGFVRSGRWGWWVATALAVGFTFLVRFTALALIPVLPLIGLIAWRWGRVRHPARVALGLLLLVPSTIVLLDVGYAGHVSLAPLAHWSFDSHGFQALQRAMPWLRLPVPAIWIYGMDRQAVESQPGATPGYLLGHVYRGWRWYYFPLAFLFKWPLGFLGALLVRGLRQLRAIDRRALARGAFLLVPLAVYLVSATIAGLDIGIRYVLPVLPMLCVWLGGLAPAIGAVRDPVRWRRWRTLAISLLALQAVEVAACAPWFLAFYNWPSGGVGGGDRLVNDSNVDWGQGLIALKETMRRYHIQRVHLAYLGTTDPAIYGIDYVPYLGGNPGPESDWLAVSSYYFVGLSQRMVTPGGRTDFVRLDFSPLWHRRPFARPAHCMYLFRIR